MGEKRLPYLYLTGAPYTGSTLMAFLLNAHPQMATIGEPLLQKLQHNRFRCSCGQLMLQCPFFLKVQDRIRELGSSFSLEDWRAVLFRISEHNLLNSLLMRPVPSVALDRIRDPVRSLWPGYRQELRRIGRRVYHLARATLEITGKQVFVDTRKDPMRIRFLQQISEIDLRVVHLVRDVRGAVVSWMKHRPSESVLLAALWWRYVNVSADKARRFVPPDRWLRILYDDLCADPQGTVDRIADFAGVDRALVSDDFYATEHHIIGNRMRLRGPGSGVVRRDDSWRSQLTDRDLATIARIAGSANRHLGHSWPP